jgi:hypothetical protein
VRRLELTSLFAPIAIEIGSGGFHQRHTLAKHGFELIGTRKFRAE